MGMTVKDKLFLTGINVYTLALGCKKIYDVYIYFKTKITSAHLLQLVTNWKYATLCMQINQAYFLFVTFYWLKENYLKGCTVYYYVCRLCSSNVQMDCGWNFNFIKFVLSSFIKAKEYLMICNMYLNVNLYQFSTLMFHHECSDGIDIWQVTLINPSRILNTCTKNDYW